LSVIIFS